MTRSFVWGHGLTSSIAHEDRKGLFGWTMPEGWRVERADAAGHGTSAVADLDPDRYTWARLAVDLLDRAPERFVAGGASMGAATALHAAVLAPERIDALVLVIPPTAWATRAAQRELYLAGADFLEQRGIDEYAALASARPSPAIFDGRPDLTDFDPDIAVELMATVLRGAAASDLPGVDALAQLDHPTLILAWTTDPSHPVETAQQLQGVLPDSRLDVADSLDEVANWPAAITAFLATLDP